MYGNIMQKTIAAQINLNVNTPDFAPVVSGAIVSGWVAFWVVVAVSLGFYHTFIEKAGLTIGKGGVGGWPMMHLRFGNCICILNISNGFSSQALDESLREIKDREADEAEAPKV